MASVESFMRGNKLIVRATWRIESVPGSEDYDTPTDPSSVTFTARRRPRSGRPADPAQAYVYGIDAEVSRVSVGVFEFEHIPEPGRWYVHVQGTDAAHGAGEVEYEIADSEALAA